MSFADQKVHIFQGISDGGKGVVDPDGISFHHRSLQAYTTTSEFDISTIEKLPDVLILSDFTGIDQGVVQRLASQPMDGLVVRTFAGGRMSEGMLAGLREIDAQDTPIVVTSRVPKGRIVDSPEYPFPAIVSNGQPDNKARILLMLVLTKTSKLAEIQRIFDTY